MSTYWLNGELSRLDGVITDGGNPILIVEFSGRQERVYCPDSEEYRITAEVVHKANDLGATIIAYSELWGGGTYEGREYAKKFGINVMPYKAFFGYLRKHGVG